MTSLRRVSPLSINEVRQTLQSDQQGRVPGFVWLTNIYDPLVTEPLPQSVQVGQDRFNNVRVCLLLDISVLEDGALSCVMKDAV